MSFLFAPLTLKCIVKRSICFLVGSVIITWLMIIEVQELTKTKDYIKFLFSNVTTVVQDPFLPADWNPTEICFDYRKLNLTIKKLNTSDSSNAKLVKKLVRESSLSPKDVENVKKFVFFVGYARSGHSIVGSMMDAHPSMIVAHEYNLFIEWNKLDAKKRNKYYLFDRLYKNSVYNKFAGWRSEVRNKKGYTLGLQYKWQGKFDTLEVIGDKSGAITAMEFNTDPKGFLMLLDEIKAAVGVDMRVIHVVRNPFDMISTRLLYEDGYRKTKVPATVTKKHCNNAGLDSQINRTFALVDMVSRFINSTHLPILDVHSADLIENSRKTMQQICRFLGVPCPSEYLEACHRKVYKSVSQTRKLVKWPQKMIAKVYEKSKPYSFLWRYAFQGD